MTMLDTPSSPNPSSVSYRQTALRYGAISGVASILISLIGFLTDTDPALPSTNGGIKAVYIIVGLGVAIWAIVSAIRHHRDRELGGYISLGRAVMVGLMVGLVAGAISMIYMFLYTTVINPDFSANMQAAMQEQWEAQGMSEEQIEMASQWSGWATGPVFMGVSQLFSGAFSGLLIGLIAGAIMKKDRPFAA